MSEMKWALITGADGGRGFVPLSRIDDNNKSK